MEGGLSSSRREEMGRHLEVCGECSSIAEKLVLSASALGSMEPFLMPKEVSERVLEHIRTPEKAARRAGGFFHSPRVIATAGVVTAALVAVAVLVGVFTADRQGTEQLTRRAAPTQSISAPGFENQGGQNEPGGATEESLGPPPLPVATITANNYNEDSIRDMADGLDVKNKFAERYSLSDAINLRSVFIQKIADEFVDVGGDGPMLEAMITFIQATEPILLPCYAERALFSGQTVYIIALSAPPRSGATKKLTRVEFWALNPEKFAANPDTSLVWWGQCQN
jgi:hypothetical protein